MTTEPNAVVAPIHEKAMPVMLMTSADIDRWLHGSPVEDARAMQKPAPDDAIGMGPLNIASSNDAHYPSFGAALVGLALVTLRLCERRMRGSYERAHGCDQHRGAVRVR
jgi:hypothetical protein